MSTSGGPSSSCKLIGSASPGCLAFLVVPDESPASAGLPGTVRLDKRATGPSKPSVANIYDIQKVWRATFLESNGVLPDEDLSALDAGLRLVFGLERRPPSCLGHRSWRDELE